MPDDISTDYELLTTWREAELFAATHMRSMGYEDAVATPLGVDGGIDVSAKFAVAQVKHYSSSPIGAPAVQRIKGAADGRRTIFYSLTGYTQAAVIFAESAGVALFRYDLVGNVFAESIAAAEMKATRHVNYDPDIPSAASTTFISDLQKFGQTVMDTLAIAMDIFNAKMDPIMARKRAGIMLPDDQRFVNVALLVFQALAPLEDRFRAANLRPTRDIIDDIYQAQSLADRLVSGWGLQLDNVAAAASLARQAGDFTDEAHRMTYAMKLL